MTSPGPVPFPVPNPMAEAAALWFTPEVLPLALLAPAPWSVFLPLRQKLMTRPPHPGGAGDPALISGARAKIAPPVVGGQFGNMRGRHPERWIRPINPEPHRWELVLQEKRPQGSERKVGGGPL